MVVSTSGTLVGRLLEQQLLLDHLKAARGGSSRAVLIRGESGIGKSRLLREAIDQARVLGFRTLLGHCHEGASALPFSCLRDAVEPLLESPPPGIPLHVVASARRALETGSDPGDGASEPRTTPGEGLGRLIRSWSSDCPALLALEDLQRADGDTWALLVWLLRRLHGSRCLVVGTLAPWASSSDPAIGLVERLVREELVTVAELGPLDEDDTRALTAELAGGVPDDDLAAAVWEAGRGNPFFVEEAMRALADSGALTVREHQATLRRRPRQLVAASRTTVLDRLRRLGDAPTRVARVLSAFGTFHLGRLPVLAELTGLPPEEVARAFDALVGAEVLHGDGEVFRFRHAIVRDTLYGSIGPAERRSIHTALAAALTSRGASGDDVFDLARHTAESAERGDAAAVATLERAGDLAVATSPGVAADWYGRALALAADPPLTLLRKRAQALFRASRLEEAVHAGTEALRLLPPGPERALVGSIVTSSLILLARMDEALQVADDVLGAAPETMPRLRSRRATILMYLGRLAEAHETGTAALNGMNGDTAGRTAAFGVLAAIEFTRGHHRACGELLERQRQAALEDGSPWALIVACAARARFLALGGDLPEARAALAEAEEVAHVQSADPLRSDFDLAHALIAWLGGDWQLALDRVRWAIFHAEQHGQLPNIPLLRAVEIFVLTAQGSFGAARAVPGDGSGAMGSALLATAVATLELATGEREAAQRRLLDGLEADDRLGRHSGSPSLLSTLVDERLEAGDVCGARAASDRLSGFAGEDAPPLVRVLALRARAAAYGDAESAAAAAETAAAHGLRFEEARSLLQLAELGVDPDAAARRAHDIFGALGADPWRRLVAARLRGLGVRVRRARTPGRPGGLSDSELRIARLLHDGMSNREIAETMFLSRKTVENYLSRIFQKTGCRTRVELALAYQSGRLG